MGLLRILLAVSVVLEHQPGRWLPALYPGPLAVEMFFIVSGFYMCLILTEKYDCSSREGVFAFYASRFFRLWPVFIVTTLLVGMLWLGTRLYLGRPPQTMAPLAEWIGSLPVLVLVWLSNLLMVGQDVMTLFHVSPASGAQFTLAHGYVLSDGAVWMGFLAPIGPAWSIGVEIWFYLLAPFLVVLPSRWLIAIAAASLALRFGLTFSGFQTYRFFPCQLAMFLFGMLGYRVSRTGPLSSRSAAMSCVAIVCCGAVAFGSLGGLDDRWRWVLYPAFALTLGALFNSTRAYPGDQVIGELSYPIYLTHVVVASAMALVLKRTGFGNGGELLLLAVVPLSLLLYWFVDKPVTAWRSRFASPARHSTVCPIGQVR